jgi:hypothetical protein
MCLILCLPRKSFKEYFEYYITLIYFEIIDILILLGKFQNYDDIEKRIVYNLCGMEMNSVENFR